LRRDRRAPLDQVKVLIAMANSSDSSLLAQGITGGLEDIQSGLEPHIAPIARSTDRREHCRSSHRGQSTYRSWITKESCNRSGSACT
jgi:hypothetical protein